MENVFADKCSSELYKDNLCTSTIAIAPNMAAHMPILEYGGLKINFEVSMHGEKPAER